MVFSLLVLATPSIGPPPSTGPLKPELEPGLEMELEGDDSGEFEFPSASEALPESPLAAVCALELTVCCTPPGGAAKAPRAAACCPPCTPPRVPCPGAWPGICPNTGPLFKLTSV